MPGPPGTPGPRHDLRRTRRLWDEPSSDAYGPRPEPPAPESPREDTPAADPRRTETRRTEGRLRNVPPLPTSFPPRQDAPPEPSVPPQPHRAPADPGVFGPPPSPVDGTPHKTPAPRTDTRPDTPAPTVSWETSAPRPSVTHLGDGPPTYDAEPTALAAADPQDLGGLVADTVLDGARYGSYTLRAASVRGDSARFRGEPRRDALLTARFGSGDGGLVLVAVASGARAAEGAHLAAAEACRWIGGAVGRSHARLAEDIRAGRRGDLKSGLHRLTDRAYGKLRARAAELGVEPGEFTADLRCLLLSADPLCRTRIYFGVGDGGLFRLRDGVWQDIEPPEPAPEALSGEAVVGFGSVPSADGEPEEGPDGDRLTMDLGITTPPSPYVDTAPPSSRFRFRASVARTDDVLLLCSAGLAEPLRGEAALAKELAERWGEGRPPGLATYLADVQLRVKGYADDRTSAAVWEA
ncbi:protein phosphatase 2C domain-containing protein [Streptomyces sp. NPDC087440]|uniref:protein phosphatase 2C domain-containing protein n=1 Tax=Streptomyces sp. NPDC087440 TaxID=3365790 RepID=UPI0037F4E7ED